MDRSIQIDSNGNDITCRKEFDALSNREDCKEREDYEKTKS